MKKIKILLAVFTGTLFYVLLSFLGGTDGVIATKNLKTQKRLISARTAKIQEINNNLIMESIALEKDNEVIASYARKLGYVKENEKLVKINGLTDSSIKLNDPGTILRHKEGFYLPEWMCKTCGFLVFFLVFMIFTLKDISSSTVVRKQRKNDFEDDFVVVNM